MDIAETFKSNGPSYEGVIFMRNLTILEILNKFPETIPVFREYDRKYSTCLCCTSMFDTVEMAAAKNRVDLTSLLNDLEKARKSS